MSQELDFNRITKRVLFGKALKDRNIPGAGTSAAEIPSRHVRVKVTMNFDGDVLEYFKKSAKAQGRSYQVLINDALREHVKGSNVEKLAQNVGDLLLSNPSFLQTLVEKINVKD